MNFKKNALRTVVGAAAMTGVAAAQAGSWAATSGAPVFATELFGTGTTAVLTPTTGIYTLGTDIATGNQQVNVTLAGGVWGAALTSSSLAYTNNGDGDNTTNGAATVALVSGGTTTDTTASFRITTGTAMENQDTFTLTYTIGSPAGLSSATTTAGPTLAFTISDTLGNADTAGAAAVVASSGNAVALTQAAAGTPANIDVTSGSVQFTDAGDGTTLSMDLGGFTLDDAVAREDGNDANFVINAGNALVTSTTVTVTGDFAASLGVDTDEDGVTTEGEGVTLSGCGLGTVAASTLTATTATFALTSANAATAAAASTECTINMLVDGTTVINPSTPTMTVAVDYTTAGYADEASSGALAAVAKNGSSAEANLLLNPAGAYDNFIRVSNGGTVAGAVTITMFNDSGDSVTFALQDSDLAAGASTDLISVATLYASAQAADATFDVGTGKLRATFSGAFSGLNVQNISTSTDGTTFFTF